MREIIGTLSLASAVIGSFFAIAILVQPSSRSWMVRLVALSLFLTSIMYLLHAAIEYFGLGEIWYAASAMTASVFSFILVFSVVLSIKQLLKAE